MITKAQRSILAAIEEDPSRTLKEIALAVNLSSESNVHMHIKTLIKNGHLQVDGRTLIKSIPLKGNVLENQIYKLIGKYEERLNCNLNSEIIVRETLSDIIDDLTGLTNENDKEE